MAAQQLAAQQAKEQEAQSKAAIKKEDSKPVKPESAAKPAPSTSTSSSNKTDKRTSPEKGATGLNWNKAKPKGSSASSSTKTKATAEAPAEDGSDQSDVEMAQIGYADSDDEADNAPAGRAPAKRADGTVQPKASSSTARRRESKGTAGKSAEEREEERRKLREMMEVEESNEDQPGEGVPPDVSTKAEASTSTMKGTDGKQTSKTAEKGELDDASTAAPSRRKVRRKRRVVRKESGKDAKGYRCEYDFITTNVKQPLITTPVLCKQSRAKSATTSLIPIGLTPRRNQLALQTKRQRARLRKRGKKAKKTARARETPVLQQPLSRLRSQKA